VRRQVGADNARLQADDPAAVADPLGRLAHPVERTSQVDGDVRLIIGIRHLCQRFHPRDAGVVNEHADESERRLGRVEQRAHLVRFGDVGSDRARTATTPRKAPKQARSLNTVTAIVEGAARILEEDAHDGFWTNAVAERTGVSVGSLYQYFPSKDALIGALIARKTSLLIAEVGLRRRVAMVERLCPTSLPCAYGTTSAARASRVCLTSRRRGCPLSADAVGR
jgi:hypothetical protein